MVTNRQVSIRINTVELKVTRLEPLETSLALGDVSDALLIGAELECDAEFDNEEPGKVALTD